MRVEFEKKMHIAGDLLSYCHLKGAVEYHFDMNTENNSSVFVIKASPVWLSVEEMEQLQKNLDAPRHREIEQSYWGLMGESENFDELGLVGVMSDEASAECEDGVLTIVIKRHD